MRFLKFFCIVAFISCIAIKGWADEAPVYEVDNYPPTFDNSNADPDMQANFERNTDNNPPPPPAPVSLSDRLARLEQQLNNLQRTDNANKIEILQRELADLRGDVEALTHQLQETQKAQSSAFSDFDKRLLSLNRPNPSPVVTEEKLPSSTPIKPTAAIQKKSSSNVKKAINSDEPNVAEEQQIYQTAYNFIKSKKYNEAITALQKMLQRYPSGQFAANAYYWLGELYSLLNKNEEAAKAFSQVINNYPDSPKVAEAQLQLGLIYAAQFKWSQAKTTFKNVINHYPGSTSARLAAEQLKQMKQAGH